MILWKDVLKPVSLKLTIDQTIAEVLDLFTESNSDIAFVFDGDQVLGYVNKDVLLNQIRHSKDLETPIEYKDDILIIPYQAPIEYYFNCSVYLAVTDGFIGYITQTDALHKVNGMKFEQINKSIDSAEIGIVTMDTDYKVTFMNVTAEEILGISRAFLVDRHYRQLIRIDQDISRVLEGAQLMNVTTSFNFKNMTGHLSPIYENGKVIGIVHIFHLQKRFEETAKELEFVRELNEDLKAIYSSSNEQILVVNGKGDIQRISGTYLETFWGELDKDMIIGSNVYKLEEKGVFRPNIFDQCLTEKRKLSLVQESKDGNKVWSTATPVFDGEKIKKIVVISRDISSKDKLDGKRTPEHRDDLKNGDEPKQKLIYKSKVISDLVNEMKQIAEVDSTVLLYGESGVGKEVFAQYIHSHSKRKDHPIVSMNCGAIPENLLESEMFGYEKGAFTGAVSTKKGLFELADKGTLFLDEITELPLNMQVKLLRALQELEIVRVGGVKTIKIDVRVIATTNRDIKKMVQEKKFREDLYYRINVIPIQIPPLRKRKEDIVSLSLHFMNEINTTYKKEKSLSREALLLLESYSWPGNVRELQNVIERLAVTTTNPVIEQEDVLKILYDKATADRDSQVFVSEVFPLKDAVKDLEEQLVSLALQKYGTAAEAAKALQVSPATISRRMNSLLKKGE
ncbi:sigma 54-interacting transcriptional regulator [Alkalihalobacillus sp. TS-13]|uniref:sigma 54-interacting transcriptional regulator n=1 Tax=Alkalihalobacillus sp. TS-13 TaxID=2842455 RepID=UPI001C887464|nr:sigma 54-interacting transcriptional regulator [Alkalihalobacillus sp. TS-13]